MKTKSPTTRIFISYSRKDATLVHYTVALIRALDVSAFRDVDSIKPGSLWENEIGKALRRSDKVFVFWSKNASESQAVRAEYQLADELGKIIIPIILDNTPVPDVLAKYQWIDKRIEINHKMENIATVILSDALLYKYGKILSTEINQRLRPGIIAKSPIKISTITSASLALSGLTGLILWQLRGCHQESIRPVQSQNVHESINSVASKSKELPNNTPIGMSDGAEEKSNGKSSAVHSTELEFAEDFTCDLKLEAPVAWNSQWHSARLPEDALIHVEDLAKGDQIRGSFGNAEAEAHRRIVAGDVPKLTNGKPTISEPGSISVCLTFESAQAGDPSSQSYCNNPSLNAERRHSFEFPVAYHREAISSRPRTWLVLKLCAVPGSFYCTNICSIVLAGNNQP